MTLWFDPLCILRAVFFSNWGSPPKIRFLGRRPKLGTPFNDPLYLGNLTFLLPHKALQFLSAIMHIFGIGHTWLTIKNEKEEGQKKKWKATSAASCHGQTCLANKWLWRHWAWYEDLSGASGSRHHKKLIPASLQRRCYIASIKTNSRRWGVWSKGDGRSYRHGHHLHDDQHKNAVIMKLNWVWLLTSIWILCRVESIVPIQ